MGQLGVSELSLLFDEDLGRYLMVTLPAFSNKVRGGQLVDQHETRPFSTARRTRRPNPTQLFKPTNQPSETSN